MCYSFVARAWRRGIDNRDRLELRFTFWTVLPGHLQLISILYPEGYGSIRRPIQILKHNVWVM
jgi:hypothetical protein